MKNRKPNKNKKKSFSELAKSNKIKKFKKKTKKATLCMHLSIVIQKSTSVHKNNKKT